MGLAEELNELLAGVHVDESQWKFVTSGGGSIGVSTPIARVGINATGGSMWVQKDGSDSQVRLDYGGIGGSLGLSLVPTPVNGSFSLPALPSTGRIYRLPFAGRSVSKRELKGAFVMLEVGADWGAGVSGAFMFMGGSIPLAMMASAVSAGSGMVPTLIATSNACVAFGGVAITVIPANVSVSIYLGAIF